MPYEAWTGNQPNVSHLQEFGTSVWIRQQDKHLTKFDPRSKMMIFIGYEDKSKYIIYYSVHTRKI